MRRENESLGYPGGGGGGVRARKQRDQKLHKLGGWMVHLRNGVAEVEEGIGTELVMRSESPYVHGMREGSDQRGLVVDHCHGFQFY